MSWVDRLCAGKEFLRNNLQESHIDLFEKTMYCKHYINVMFSDGIRCKDCNLPEHTLRPVEPHRMWGCNRDAYLRTLAKMIGLEILNKSNFG